MSRIIALLALGALLLPITASPRIPQTPQIRVSTHLVEIGVIVRSNNGPVENLTKDDFTILDRGKPQEIGIFSANAAPAEQQTSHPLPPDTFSDLPQYAAAAQPRSITVVLLDNLNTLYGSSSSSQWETSPYWLEDLALKNGKNHLIEFVKQLQPEDRVAIYGLGHSLHVLCDFTCNRDQLLAVLNTYSTASVTNRQVVEPGNTDIMEGGHMAPVPFTRGNRFENGASQRLAGAANQDRAAETTAALQQIASHVANIPGRKNLVWLTANLPFSGEAMARVLSPADIAVYPIDARGLLSKSPMVLADIPGTADADEVSGAAGHMDNMPAQSAQPIGIATMQKVANETGGQAFVNTNDLTGAIRKAVEDSAVTYTLGFYINRDALDGKFHEIKVELKRKGLTLRYPKGYFAFPDTVPTQKTDQQMVETAMESPIASSMIPLQATLKRGDPAHPNTFNLVCHIDLHHIQFAQSGDLRKGAVTVYVIGQNAAGQALHNWSKTYDLQFNDTQYRTMLESGIPFHQGIQLTAGVTTLRVMVEDPVTSVLGSLIIPLSQIN